MIEPCRPPATIARAAACAQKNVPLRFTSSTWSQSASRMSRNGDARIDAGIVDEHVEAAQLARGRRRPWRGRRAACATSPCTTRRLPPGARTSRGHLLGGVAVVEVVDGHVGALARERQRHRAPDALLGAR